MIKHRRVQLTSREFADVINHLLQCGLFFNRSIYFVHVFALGLLLVAEFFCRKFVRNCTSLAICLRILDLCLERIHSDSHIFEFLDKALRSAFGCTLFDDFRNRTNSFLKRTCLLLQLFDFTIHHFQFFSDLLLLDFVLCNLLGHALALTFQLGDEIGLFVDAFVVLFDQTRQNRLSELSLKILNSVPKSRDFSLG